VGKNKGGITQGKEFVLGFMFDTLEPHAKVLLTEKLRPKWQAGKLNGIGGAMKPGETPIQAMIREFKEETGATFDGWAYFCTMRYVAQETIHCFYGVGSLIHRVCKAQTDEALNFQRVSELFYYDRGCVSDIRWLVPMAFGMANENCHYIEVIKCGVIVPNG
jgi:8-oxo-dGTP diphosphatase